MGKMKFSRELYSKTALIKAAYNFTDVAYLHLDADHQYYYVTIEPKENEGYLNEEEFVNEMLAQSVRHEIYCQTKNIRELMLARAMATSVVMKETSDTEPDFQQEEFCESEILRDWFEANENKDE